MSRCFHCGQETGTLFVDAEGIARCCACHAMANKVAIVTNCDCCDGEVHRLLEGVKTRGELRQLLAALGWREEVKG